MLAADLLPAIEKKGSYLCVGLDTDLGMLPTHLGKGLTGMLAFNKAIIEATVPYAISYKINTAFYEALGSEGWEVMEETRRMIPADCYAIADAKRGDIGNTAARYAEAFLGRMGFDALTVNPYMGLDTLEPYLEQPKGDIIVLACTSNPGWGDFENQLLANGRRLYEEVVIRCGELEPKERVHFVAGATRPEQLARVRALAPEALLLVPGIGAQGGDLKAVSTAGFIGRGILLVNTSRSILYASPGHDFAEKAGQEASHLAGEMGVILKTMGIV